MHSVDLIATVAIDVNLWGVSAAVIAGIAVYVFASVACAVSHVHSPLRLSKPAVGVGSPTIVAHSVARASWSTLNAEVSLGVKGRRPCNHTSIAWIVVKAS